MTGLGFAIRSFLHYLRFNLTVAIGVAISTAILTGGLIVGDSVRYSLEQSTRYRLGDARWAITTGDRFTTASLAALVNSRIAMIPSKEESFIRLMNWPARGGRILRSAWGRIICSIDWA